MPFVIAIHVIVCFLLIALLLIQRGRGGGLLESFSGVESMFGTKTNAFLTKMTTILSVIFFISCLGLAVLSVKQSRSLMPKTASTSLPVRKSNPAPAAPIAPAPPAASAAPVAADPVAAQPQTPAP